MDLETEVSDVVEDVVDVAKKNGLLIPVAFGLLVVGAGIGIGYLIGQRKKYEVIKLGDRLPTAPPKVIVDATDIPLKGKTVEEIVVDEGYVQDDVIDEEDIEDEVVITVNESVVEHNIFAHADDDDWDYDEEIKKRSPLVPYPIHRDEFFSEEMGSENFSQSQLTYYAGDNVLVDEQDHPIHNHRNVVGELKWGHGSGDPNVVYVRNMGMSAEYEITRDPGHYRVEILGLEMEEAATVKEKKEERVRRSRMRQE